MTRSIEMLPMVFLKNTSSMACDETARKAGNKMHSFPNRKGCVGYAVASYLLSVIWVWSWKAMICWRSFRCWYEDDEGLDDCVDDGTVEEDEEEEEEDDDEEDVDKGEAEEAGGGDESEDELSDDVDDEEVGEMDDDDAVDVDDSVFAANAKTTIKKHQYSKL